MDRATYNACVSEKIKEVKEPGMAQKVAFCLSAKMCAKGMSESEAKTACEQSMTHPKEPKARRARGAAAKCGVRLVLLTTSDCAPCQSAKAYFKDKIDKGLIQELNIQKSDEAADLAAKYGFTSVPKLLVLDDEGIPFSELQITDSEQTI